jgi:uncharacterized protein (TIRG00374 family)
MNRQEGCSNDFGNGRTGKKTVPGIRRRRLIPGVSGRLSGYLTLTGLFFLISLSGIYLVHHRISGKDLHLDPRLYSPKTLGALILLLVLYYLFDGLRLYFVIKAMRFRVDFVYIMKLVFVNVFVSSITPLATGGGVVQVYFLSRRGIPIGESTAATTIRTILAASILFTLTPVIILVEPNLSGLFFKGNLIVYIVLFCTLYLGLFVSLLFFTRAVRYRLYRLMRLLNGLHILSRRRFRTWYRRISRELVRFADGFRRFTGGHLLHVLSSMLFTGLFLLTLFSFSVVLIRTLGYKASPLTILAFQVVVTFFMYFAPTPGAAGVAEGGYGLLFSRLVSSRDLTLLTLLWRFLTIYISVLIGLYVVYREIFSSRRNGS